MLGDVMAGSGKPVARPELEGLVQSANRIAEIQRHPGSADGDGCHDLFSDLYHAVTTEWLRVAQRSGDPAQIHLLIIHFHELFDRYVLRMSDAGHIETTRHWHRYFTAHTRAGLKPVNNAVALYFAIRAHTRFDLAEAICAVHSTYRATFGRDPDLSHLRTEIYGPIADRVFTDACRNFLDRRGRQGWHWKVLIRAAGATVWLWLPILQAGRRAAWREATASIASGEPPARPLLPVNPGLKFA